jgi:hypothetical protein
MSKLLYRLGDIEAKPPEWLIKGFLETASLASIFAPSDSYKSFLAIAASAPVATGVPFNGLEVTNPGPVIYIAGEGHRGLRRRFRAWEIQNHHELEETPIYVSSRAVPLGDPEAMKPVVQEIDDIAHEEGAPQMIVVDTLSRNIAGDENSSADMPAFVEALDQLKNRYRATVLVVHHTGHGAQERSRGHSAFRAALDWEYRLERETEGFARLVVTKSKDTAPPEPMRMKLEQVVLDVFDDRGEAVTSAALELTNEEPTQDTKPLGKWQQVAFETLQQEYANNRANLEKSGRDPAEARVFTSDWRKACQKRGMNRQRFNDVLHTLKDRNLITLDSSYVYLRPSGEFPEASVASGSGAPKGAPGPDGRSGHAQPDETGRKPDANRTQSGHQPDGGEKASGLANPDGPDAYEHKKNGSEPGVRVG